MAQGSSDRQQADFNLRGPITITIDEQHQTFGSGCKVYELVVKTPMQIKEVWFRNYYTAYVTLKMKTKHSKDDRWKTSLESKKLMPSIHHDKGSQDYISITYKQSVIPWKEVVGILVILRQPSTVWKNFDIENIHVFKDSPKLVMSLPVMPVCQVGRRWETTEAENSENTESQASSGTNKVSRYLPNAWALLQAVCREVRSETPPKIQFQSNVYERHTSNSSDEPLK